MTNEMLTAGRRRINTVISLTQHPNIKSRKILNLLTKNTRPAKLMGNSTCAGNFECIISRQVKIEAKRS